MEHGLVGGEGGDADLIAVSLTQITDRDAQPGFIPRIIRSSSCFPSGTIG